MLKKIAVAALLPSFALASFAATKAGTTATTNGVALMATEQKAETPGPQSI